MTVWCALSRAGIIGPFFLEGNDDKEITVISDHYIQMIFLEGIILRDVWFQQDGATAHTAGTPMALFP